MPRPRHSSEQRASASAGEPYVLLAAPHDGTAPAAPRERFVALGSHLESWAVERHSSPCWGRRGRTSASVALKRRFCRTEGVVAKLAKHVIAEGSGSRRKDNVVAGDQPAHMKSAYLLFAFLGRHAFVSRRSVREGGEYAVDYFSRWTDDLDAIGLDAVSRLEALDPDAHCGVGPLPFYSLTDCGKEVRAHAPSSLYVRLLAIPITNATVISAEKSPANTRPAD